MPYSNVRNVHVPFGQVFASEGTLQVDWFEARACGAQWWADDLGKGAAEMTGRERKAKSIKLLKHCGVGNSL